MTEFMTAANAAAAIAHIAERDGCGCPPWILRCAHWGGRILILIDNDAVDPSGEGCSNPRHDPTYSGQRYGVGDIAEWGTIPGCGHLGWRCEPTEQFSSSASLSDAEAAFYRREAELLEREP